MMMTLLFDLFSAQPAGSSKFHGGGETIKSTFKKLADCYLDRINMIVFYDNDRFLDEWILDSIRFNKIEAIFIKELNEISNILREKRIDILYSGIPYYYKKEWIPESVRFVGTIHGLRFVELPADKYAYMFFSGIRCFKENLKYIFRNKWREKKRKDYEASLEILDEIITDSCHSEYSIRYNYPKFDNKKIHVLYPPPKNNVKCDLEVPIVCEPYILVMGSDRWEKNGYRELSALENIFTTGKLPGYKVVVIGGLRNGLRSRIEDINRYIVKDYVGSEELENLYKYCKVFLYASLNEGFGLPPLEAMRYGRTCVVSGICSLPEVCGEVAYYVNPYDINEIAIRVLTAVNNSFPPTQVVGHYNQILKKQISDLDKICEVIIG